MENVLITKERMKHIVDAAYDTRSFQAFISVMTHAQTCKECSDLFHESMKKAQNHLAIELV
ncbi:MAG: hypothetical protein HY223_01030 [Thaumarchaeota archaeon]|nr:hypothetical protein [Nitrososphaerota archaeon]